MRDTFIDTPRPFHRLVRLCAVLPVSRSGYEAWCRRPASHRAQATRVLVEQMRQLHRQTRERYGAVKLWHALTAAGIRCGRHRVARLRRLPGLVARRTRRVRVLVEHHQFAPPAPNRLQPGLTVLAANRVWAGDLTTIRTRVGWLYLAVVLDLYSRRVVGWAMSVKPDQQVALEALRRALLHRRPQPGLRFTTRITARWTPAGRISRCWASRAWSPA